MQEMGLNEAPLVRYSVEEGVMTLTLDGAANGNALTVAMTEALSDVLENVNRRDDVHCLLLRSSSKHFCTGGNVKDMQSGKDLMDGGIEQVRERLRRSLHRITRALNELEVPSICAVNGAAVGAGCDLALMCDIRLAGTRAVFAESFLRLGLVSGIGGAWFLSRIVGPAKALELTLTSEFIDAEAAKRLGIVTSVYPDDALEREALALAQRIAGSPPLALRMAKKLVRESSQCTLSAALEMAANMQAILLCGSEHKEAVSGFLEQQARQKSKRTECGAA
ncbi:enoyl-CoA hydratase/carnithine racemase [Burkholderia sp. Ch1-1]|uniref:Enoyl-CoA hydratase/carnithine racemase n=2 Tax=Burkholderiaceae TaxID=119060 RepID=A0A5Q4Z6Z7_9BURK|nr:enoyl-CoA hydratase/carnithine racemase [Burkholderia sp. Ch1-1]VVD29005.1 Enoyl-CoA hydratase/carnithine racemase [Paraburkholderia dioscoreae]